MNCRSLPGSSVHGITQARILEWVAISFSRGSSWPRDQTHISCTSRWTLYHWAIWETPTKFSCKTFKMYSALNIHILTLHTHSSYDLAKECPEKAIYTHHFLGLHATSTQDNLAFVHTIRTVLAITWVDKSNEQFLVHISANFLALFNYHAFFYLVTLLILPLLRKHLPDFLQGISLPAF